MTQKNNAPICMTEEFWASSQLSVARYYGRIKINGHEYWILDKKGRDLFECSAIADKEGREKAIEPGEPADLVRDDFRKVYRALGRDRFLQILKDNTDLSDEAILRAMKTEARNNKRKKELT